MAVSAAHASQQGRNWRRGLRAPMSPWATKYSPHFLNMTVTSSKLIVREVWSAHHRTAGPPEHTQRAHLGENGSLAPSPGERSATSQAARRRRTARSANPLCCSWMQPTNGLPTKSSKLAACRTVKARRHYTVTSGLAGTSSTFPCARKDRDACPPSARLRLCCQRRAERCGDAPAPVRPGKAPATLQQQ
jgi:hypothetical protein